LSLALKKIFGCSHDLRRGTVVSSPLTKKLTFIALHDKNFKLLFDLVKINSSHVAANSFNTISRLGNDIAPDRGCQQSFR
jgi:hypothetical protein